LMVEFAVMGIPCLGQWRTCVQAQTKQSRFRSQPLTRPKRIATGTPVGNGGKERGWWCKDDLLDSHDHGVGPYQVFDAGFFETDFFHPAHAVGAGVVEATVGFDQHVETHEEPKGVL